MNSSMNHTSRTAFPVLLVLLATGCPGSLTEGDKSDDGFEYATGDTTPLETFQTFASDGGICQALSDGKVDLSGYDISSYETRGKNGSTVPGYAVTTERTSGSCKGETALRTGSAPSSSSGSTYDWTANGGIENLLDLHARGATCATRLIRLGCAIRADSDLAGFHARRRLR